MIKFILQFARNIYVQKLLTAQSVRLSHYHSKYLTSPQKGFKMIIGASRLISTTNRKYDFVKAKTPLNKKFIAFNESINSQETDFTMTHSEWENLETEILEETPEFVNSIDYSIMKSLSNKADLSVSFYRYLVSKREPNISTLVEFIVNCAGKYDDLVFEVLEKMKTTFDPLYFKVVGSKIAFGISKTNEWRQAVNYLDYLSDMNQELPTFAVRTLINVFRMSLIHQDYKTFCEVFKKYLSLLKIHQMSDRKTMSQTFFNCWKDGVIPADLLFEILKLDVLPLEEEDARHLQAYCDSEWPHIENAEQAKVDVKRIGYIICCFGLGVTYMDKLPLYHPSHEVRVILNLGRRSCSFCGGIVPEIEAIGESIRLLMFQEVLQKMMNDEDKCSKISDEIREFQNLIKKQNQPFDYVIDTFNIPPNYFSRIMKNLSYKGKHVLLVGKSHNHRMYTGYGQILFMKGEGAPDDLFMILAAIYWNCYLLTNDDFADHFCKVDEKLKPYFYLWRDHKRVFHVKKKLLHPPEYKWTAHETEEGWHIPFTKNVKTEGKEDINILLRKINSQMFLCVRKSNYVPSPELLKFREIYKSVLEHSEKQSDSTDESSETV